jgi:AcrR family transcriptional regulator
MLRTQHAEATRRAVLDAARSLFGRQGYAQTSVDQIAAAARVTKGAVYHHFSGKEALCRAVYDEVETEAQARAAGAPFFMIWGLFPQILRATHPDHGTGARRLAGRRHVGAQVSAERDELDPLTTMPKVAEPPELTDPL